MRHLVPQRLHFSELDSTNAHARKLAEAGEKGPFWISADRQTNGRGRRGRKWVSDAGNLFATYLTALAITAPTASQIGFVAALSVYDTAANFLGAPDMLDLKWPNDVLLDKQKLSGILAETLPGENRNEIVVALGIGVNINSAPHDTPYGAIALNRFLAAPITPQVFLTDLIANTDKWLALWDNGNSFEIIKDAFLQRCSFVGQEVVIKQPDQDWHGRFMGLAQGGELVLETHEGEQKTFSAGDVSLRG